MNTIREIERINEEELKRGIAGTSASWHAQYERSPWVYIGNLDHELSEGDVVSVMSQFGEIEDLHLVRDEDTGKSRGFAFCKYEDPKSCILAVDNFVGVKILDRPMRVDHVENYRLPKNILEKQQELKDKGEKSTAEGIGHAYEGVEMENGFNLQQGQDLFAPVAQREVDEEKQKRKEERARKREEKERKRQRKEERRERRESKKKHKKPRSRR